MSNFYFLMGKYVAFTYNQRDAFLLKLKHEQVHSSHETSAMFLILRLRLKKKIATKRHKSYKSCKPHKPKTLEMSKGSTQLLSKFLFERCQQSPGCATKKQTAPGAAAHAAPITPAVPASRAPPQHHPHPPREPKPQS